MNNENLSSNIGDNEYNPEIVSKRLKAARELNGYTLEEAANLVGITKSKLSKAEKYSSYKQGYKPEFLLAFAQAMDCSVDYLVGLCDSPEGEPLESMAASVVRETESILQSHLPKISLTLMRHAILEAYNKGHLEIYKRSFDDWGRMLEESELFLTKNPRVSDMPGGIRLIESTKENRKRYNLAKAEISSGKPYSVPPLDEKTLLLRLSDAMDETLQSSLYKQNPRR